MSHLILALTQPKGATAKLTLSVDGLVQSVTAHRVRCPSLQLQPKQNLLAAFPAAGSQQQVMCATYERASAFALNSASACIQPVQAADVHTIFDTQLSSQCLAQHPLCCYLLAKYRGRWHPLDVLILCAEPAKDLAGHHCQIQNEDKKGDHACMRRALLL